MIFSLFLRCFPLLKLILSFAVCDQFCFPITIRIREVLSRVFARIPIHRTHLGVTAGSRNIRQEKALWETSRAAAR